MTEKRGRVYVLFLATTIGLAVYSRIPNFSPPPLAELIPADVMRIALSLILTGASIFVILRKEYGPKDKHWAYATIGTILGFWLRGPK